MNDQKFFLHQIKRTSGVFTKGIVVNDTFDQAKQSYHAYLGAYAYGHEANTDYVSCMITDMWGNIVNNLKETWMAPEPEPNA
jgi:hypothetical protein